MIPWGGQSIRAALCSWQLSARGPTENAGMHSQDTLPDPQILIQCPSGKLSNHGSFECLYTP